MPDLMVLVTVRRLLLELGCQLRPEAPGAVVGPLSLWIHEPRPDFEGLSPLQAMQGDGGEQQVRECLRRMVTHRTSEASFEHIAAGLPGHVTPATSPKHE